MDLNRIDEVLANMVRLAEEGAGAPVDTAAPPKETKGDDAESTGATKSGQTSVSKSDAIKSHWHRAYTDDKGDGKTDDKESHTHKIVSGVVKPAGGHTHEMPKSNSRKSRGLKAGSFKGGSEPKKRKNKKKPAGIASVTPDVTPAAPPGEEEETVESLMARMLGVIREESEGWNSEWAKTDREVNASDFIDDSRNILATYALEASKSKKRDKVLFKEVRKQLSDLDKLASDLQKGNVDKSDFMGRMEGVHAAIEKNRVALGKSMKKRQFKDRATIVWMGALTAASAAASVATGGAFNPVVAVFGAANTLVNMATSTNAKSAMSSFGKSFSKFKSSVTKPSDEQEKNDDNEEKKSKKSDKKPKKAEKSKGSSKEAAVSACTKAGGKMVYGRCVKNHKVIKVEGTNWLEEEYGLADDSNNHTRWSTKSESFAKYAILENLLENADHVIDVGCGKGLLYKWLLSEQSKNVAYYGVDRSEDSLSEFAHSYPNITANLRRGNVLSINEEDLPRDHFDVSVAFGVTSNFGEGSGQYSKLRQLVEFMTSHSDVSVIEFWDRFKFKKPDHALKGDRQPSVWTPQRVMKVFSESDCHVQLVRPLSGMDFAVVATRSDMRRV